MKDPETLREALAALVYEASLSEVLTELAEVCRDKGKQARAAYADHAQQQAYEQQAVLLTACATLAHTPHRL